MKIFNPLLIALLAIAPVIAAAELGPIIVTPSIIEQEREKSATPITVIDAETIARSGANNMAELLRGQAGLHLSDLFGDGVQVTVDLRGFGPTAFSNTLVLIDGRRLNNSTDGSPPDISSIDLEDIEQIEILQGSGGVIYGNQAVGGVINIIRKKDRRNKTQLSLKTGSYNATQIRASIDQQIGETQLTVSATDSRSDNYRDHNKTELRDVFLRASRDIQGYVAYVELAASNDHIETPGALLLPEIDASRTQSLSMFSNDFFDTRTDSLRIGLDREIDRNSSFNIDYSKRIDDREFMQTFRPTPATTLDTQDRDTQILSGKYILKPEDSDGSSLVFGVNFEATDYKLMTSFGPQEMDQSINDAYLLSNWNAGPDSVVTAGIRYSDQQAEVDSDNFDDSVTVVSLGVTRRIGDWKLNVRADQNFRYPTVEEHTNVPFGSSPGLKTQEGVSLEFGAETFVDNDRYRVTLYGINLDNEIGFDSSDFSNFNIDSTSRRGLILEAGKQWAEKFSTSASFTFVDAEVTDGALAGNQLPLVPEKTLRLDSIFQYDDATRFNLEVIAIDEQTYGGDFNNQLSKLERYTVTNASIYYALQQWELAFRINNLFDKEYAESGSQFTDFSAFPTVTNHESAFPAPERNYWLSVKYSF